MQPQRQVTLKLFLMCRKEDFIDKSLPFHLVVLEWALQTATQSVTAEAIRLESQVDAITQKIIKQVCIVFAFNNLCLALLLLL